MTSLFHPGASDRRIFLQHGLIKGFFYNSNVNFLNMVIYARGRLDLITLFVYFIRRVDKTIPFECVYVTYSFVSTFNLCSLDAKRILQCHTLTSSWMFRIGICFLKAKRCFVKVIFLHLLDYKLSISSSMTQDL